MSSAFYFSFLVGPIDDLGAHVCFDALPILTNDHKTPLI